MNGGNAYRLLPLGVLRCFAGALKSVFLAFFDPRIASHQAFPAQKRLELLVSLNQCPGNAMANSPGLSTDATTIHLDLNIELTLGISSHERVLDIAAVLTAGENVLIRLAIDSNLSSAREKLSAVTPPPAT